MHPDHHIQRIYGGPADSERSSVTHLLHHASQPSSGSSCCAEAAYRYTWRWECKTRQQDAKATICYRLPFFCFFQSSDLCLWSSAVSIHMCVRDEPSTGLWASPTPSPTWSLSMTGVLCRQKTRVSSILWNQLRSKYGMVGYQYSAPWVILYYGREAHTFRSYEKLIQWCPLVVGLTQGNGSTDDLALICQEVCQQQIWSDLETMYLML